MNVKGYSPFSSLVRVLFALLLLSIGVQVAHAERKTTYYHNDALGSVVAASNDAGALLWRKEYAPFGEQLDSTTEQEKLAYTGKEHDDVTGLTYFGARYYDPHLGRFMSVDPAGINPGNILSFNRYMYANDNPYKFVDPDGRETIFVGGAGVDGTYIGDMTRRLAAAGIVDVRAASSSAASFGSTILDAGLVTKWNQDLGKSFYSRYAGRVKLSAPEGQQLNLVGYSHGSIVASQVALALAAGGQRVDNLVLIGAPINKSLLDAVSKDPYIGRVHVFNLTGQGDPIYAGMSDAEIVRSLPTLVGQMAEGNGHFYYAPATEDGNARRSQLAKEIKDKGLR